MMVFMTISFAANVVVCQMSPCGGRLRRRCHTSVMAFDACECPIQAHAPAIHAPQVDPGA
jgi:hypothetical protein